MSTGILVRVHRGQSGVPPNGSGSGNHFGRWGTERGRWFRTCTSSIISTDTVGHSSPPCPWPTRYPPTVPPVHCPETPPGSFGLCVHMTPKGGLSTPLTPGPFTPRLNGLQCDAESPGRGTGKKPTPMWTSTRRFRGSGTSLGLRNRQSTTTTHQEQFEKTHSSVESLPLRLDRQGPGPRIIHKSLMYTLRIRCTHPHADEPVVRSGSGPDLTSVPGIGPGPGTKGHCVYVSTGRVGHVLLCLGPRPRFRHSPSSVEGALGLVDHTSRL